MTGRFVSIIAALLLALNTSLAADDDPRFVNPDGLFKPGTFSQIAIVKGSEIVFISGQTSRDEKSQVVGVGDLRKQTEQALVNLRIAVEAIGGSIADIAKITTYVVNLQPDDRFWIGAMVKQHFPAPPAHTLIGISALAAPELLVEIEAVAVLD